MAGNAVALYDANGNPIAGLGNTALASTQAALVNAGSDYGPSPKAQVMKVDGHGSQYVTQATPAGTAAQVFTGQAPPISGSQFGTLTMIRQDTPAPAQYVPLTADMIGSLNVHLKAKQSFRSLATGISCAANKSLFTLVNTGTQIIRLQEMWIYVPPSGAGSSGGLLGGGSMAYYPLICELRRLTPASVSGGTPVALTPTDTADALAAGVSAAIGATVSGTINTYHRQDACQSTGSGIAWYARGDPNEKSFVCRPGEGFAVTCVSSGTINNASGSGTTTAVVDIMGIYTQAPA